MNLKCYFGNHQWTGCQCYVCGKRRDEDHDWSKNCETCKTCGATQDNAHSWKGCTCSTCAQTRDEAHSGESCTCTTCGRTRPQNHDWSKDCTRCATCQTTRNARHDFSKDCNRCSLCGYTIIGGHCWSDYKCSKCGKTENALFIAVKKRDLPAVKLCIQEGVDVNALTQEGYTLLQIASFTESGLEIVDTLLNAGAQVNATGEDSCIGPFYPTALSTAAYQANLDIMRRLLHAGADPMATDEHGQTAFQLLLKGPYWEKRSTDTFWELVGDLEEGRAWAKSNVGKETRRAYDSRRSDLFSEVDWDDAHKVEAIARTADVQALSHRAPQFNALHKAAHRGYLNLVKLMIEKGVDVNCRASTGETPLVMALNYMYDSQTLSAEVVKFLLDHGASTTIASRDGTLPLPLAQYLAQHAQIPELKKEAEIALAYLRAIGT